MKTESVVCDTPEEAAAAASDLIQRLSALAINERGAASLAVSGGTTPQALFKRWQLETFPNLHCVHIFMSDERIVPTSSADSNHGTMLNLWPDVSQAKTHFPNTENVHVDQIASDYQQELIEILGAEPVFDCVMLGLGEDGHTASLFPGKASLNDENLVCLAEHGDLPPAVLRMTLTFRCINLANNVVVIATGCKKRHWIEELQAGKIDKYFFPLIGVKPQGKLWVVMDKAAWPEA